MLVFNPGRLTAAGKNLLAEVQGGAEKITFTKFVFGSGSYSSSENIADRSSLKEPKQEFPVSSRTVENKSTVTLLCILTNKASDDDILTEGYTIREVGLYARNAAGNEILYCLSTAATPDMMPAYDGHSIPRANITYTIEVGDADAVEIVSEGAYASAEELIKITARVEKLEESVGVLQNSNLASEKGAFGVRYWNKKWQIKNADGTFKDASGGDNEQLSQDITALMVAVTLLKGSAINGTSGNVVVETFDDANSYVMVSGQYDKTNKRLYA